MPIVELNNPNNTGTLSSVQRTVVWWDDAEGEMQPYHLRQNFTGYYRDRSDLLHPTSVNYFYPPKNGLRSIAVGGTNTAKLHLRINLERRAKLSFWYANRFNGTAGTTFTINDVEQRRWAADINWSFIEFDLEPGWNDIVWEKNDGTRTSGVDHFYLSLDDILIYYTE
jgi:hypothetical protein